MDKKFMNYRGPMPEKLLAHDRKRLRSKIWETTKEEAGRGRGRLEDCFLKFLHRFDMTRVAGRRFGIVI